MPLDLDKLVNFSLPTREVDFSHRDVMLYALSVGLGADPMNSDELRLVTENRLRALPTFATIVTYDTDRMEKLGANRTKSLHGEQRLTLLRPMPSEGRVRVRERVEGVFDKGEKGAIIVVAQSVHDRADDSLISTATSVLFDRSGGGCGSTDGEPPKVHRVPDSKPDHVVDTPTLPQQALLYRLNGDYNPLHSDPDFAAQGGFERPILHGLCTYGISCVAIVRSCADMNPDRLVEYDARFTAPVIPGETLRTEIWQADNDISFRTRVVERDLVVLDNGRAVLAN